MTKKSKKKMPIKKKMNALKKTAPMDAQKLLEVKAREEDGNTIYSLDVSTPEGLEKLAMSTGCQFFYAGQFLLTQGLEAAISGRKDADAEDAANKYLGLMNELNPLDGFEGLLISQMVTIYAQAMACFQRSALNTEYPEALIKYQNQGIKLMRVYNQQLETLDKHRRKGNQKMTVEHVHVHKGGQAIVGTVNQGGRDNEK